MPGVLFAWLAIASTVHQGSGGAAGPVPYDSTRTQVVLLGTGTPNADPDRSGPAVAVVVHGRAYLVDAGPGIVRRAAAAASRVGVAALRMENLRVVFLTHLHSDHTLGLPDLMLSPWVLGRTVPLDVYGPNGSGTLIHHLLAAYAADIDNRRRGTQPHNNTGWQVSAHVIQPGVVYRDSLVTVTAFAVPHDGWREAYGFRFDTADRTIVISGDTRASQSVVRACHGCDVLVHEVYAQAGYERITPDWQRYHAEAHTSGVELGRLATQARPKLLILYHGLPWSATPDDILREVRDQFGGAVVYGNDLDVY